MPKHCITGQSAWDNTVGAVPTADTKEALILTGDNLMVRTFNQGGPVNEAKTCQMK